MHKFSLSVDTSCNPNGRSESPSNWAVGPGESQLHVPWGRGFSWGRGIANFFCAQGGGSGVGVGGKGRRRSEEGVGGRIIQPLEGRAGRRGGRGVLHAQALLLSCYCCCFNTVDWTAAAEGQAVVWGFPPDALFTPLPPSGARLSLPWQSPHHGEGASFHLHSPPPDTLQGMALYLPGCTCLASCSQSV